MADESRSFLSNNSLFGFDKRFFLPQSYTSWIFQRGRSGILKKEKLRLLLLNFDAYESMNQIMFPYWAMKSKEFPLKHFSKYYGKTQSSVVIPSIKTASLIFSSSFIFRGKNCLKIGFFVAEANIDDPRGISGTSR